jgi:hypothetical protein
MAGRDEQSPEWKLFEERVAQKLDNFGWKIELTKSSNDFGADVLAQYGREKLVVQCKFFRADLPLSDSVVREVMVAKQHYKAKHGLIVYRGLLTRRLLEKAMTQKISVLTYEQLVPRSYFDIKSARGEEPEFAAKVTINCPACNRLNNLPRAKEGYMTCGHCGARSFQRT